MHNTHTDMAENKQYKTVDNKYSNSTDSPDSFTSTLQGYNSWLILGIIDESD